MCAVMKTAVVTGANGFLGLPLCRNLSQKGVRVFAVIRDGAVARGLGSLPGVKVVFCGFSEYRALAEKIDVDGVDTLFHMAWAGVNGELKQECDVQLDNIRAACDIIYACKNMECKRIVFPATVSEYGVYEMMRTEHMPPPATLYHSAKLAADFFMRTLAGELGMEYIRGLIPSVYGPCFETKTTIFLHQSMERLLRGEHCSFTTGEQPYDFVYVDDAVEAFARLGGMGRGNRTYYIGNPPRRLRDFLEELAEVVAPRAKLGFGELPDTGIILDYGQFYSNALFEDTGFRPKIDFKEGVEQTLLWLKRNTNKVMA